MILRKVSNLRPDDHVIIHKYGASILTTVRVDRLPESEICVLIVKQSYDPAETAHTLLADDYVEIVIL